MQRLYVSGRNMSNSNQRRRADVRDPDGRLANVEINRLGSPGQRLARIPLAQSRRNASN
jgi:hypothetical protein